MTENILYSRKEGRSEEKEGAKEEEKMYIQLDDLEVRERERKTSKCENCVSLGRYKSVAVFLCFLCEMYVCGDCLYLHQPHDGMKVEKKVLRERVKKIVQKAKMEREKNESKRMLGKFVDNLMNECEKERRKELKNSHRIVCDRVEVKHELDQKEDCWVTGWCGLENRRLVVCDFWNSCIKIFKLGSYVLQRYILFVESDSQPCDVTEINLKQNFPDWAYPDIQCLVAVTLSRKRQIMFIDLSKKPAKPQKVIQTKESCWNIQFYDDKIFTVSRKDRNSPRYVYIYSTDGDTLNMFDTWSYRSFTGPYLAVVSGRVYITIRDNDIVQCRNVEGQFISEIEIVGSGPAGISVDPDNNVYVCAREHDKVYKLNADLTRYMSVLDRPRDYIESPGVLCYYRDKLFISHSWRSSLHNFVTVIRLL